MHLSNKLLFLCLFIALLTAGPSHAVPVSISVEPPVETELSAVLVAHGSTQSTKERRTSSFELELDGKAHIDLPSGSWKLELNATDYWAAPRLVTLEDSAAAVAFEIWPAAKAQGQIVLPEDEPPLERIRLEFVPTTEAEDEKSETAEPEDLPSGVVSCPVEDLQWVCSLPVGAFDLRLDARAYVSHFMWNVSISSGEVAELGAFPLERGSSITGWVEIAGAESELEGVEISLRPRALRLPLTTSEKRVERSRITASTNDRGFFQITGMAPGQYVIEASKANFAPARASVEVLADQITEISDPPLILHPPQILEVFVDPPTPPEGSSWWIEITQLDGSAEVLKTGESTPVAADGSWQSSGLSPGRFQIDVQPEGGDIWHSERLDVAPGIGPLFVEMPVVRVVGSVSLGDDPLAATLSFRTVRLASEADGSFEGYLPREGEWTVQVSSEEPTVRRAFQGVEVRKSPGKSYAEVTLHVPKTVLEGEVVDAVGQPVPKAVAIASSLDEIVLPSQKRTDAKGRFEILGLPEGLAAVVAMGAGSGGRLFSEELEVDLEDGATRFVQLVLRPELVIPGRVVAGTRGVPGASVKAEPVGFRGLPIFPANSGPNGNFELRLPWNTREVFLSVGAPGFAFRMAKVALDPGEPLLLPVEPAMGTIVIEVPHSLSRARWNAPKVFLSHGGSIEALGYLLTWSRFHGFDTSSDDLFILPAMESGAYTACRLHFTERLLPLTSSSESQDCVSGYLSPNGELRLHFAPAETED